MDDTPRSSIFQFSQQPEGLRILVADPTPKGAVFPLGHGMDGDITELIDHYDTQMKALPVDLFLVLTQGDCLRKLRAATLAGVRQGRALHILITCDETGCTMSGMDVLAALVVLQSMGIASFAVKGCVEGLVTQLRRLAPVAAVPLGACADEWQGADTVSALVHAGATILYVYEDDAVPIFTQVLANTHIVPRDHQAHALVATASDAFFVDPTIDVSDPIPCDPDFSQSLLTHEENASALSVVITTQDELDIFADNQYMITTPLCLGADSAELLEAALRVYDGRAFYYGGTHIEDDDLHRLHTVYGLLLF